MPKKATVHRGPIHCLAAGVTWLRVNKLKPKPGMTEVMLNGKAKFLKDIMRLTFCGVQLTLADSIKNFGVILDQKKKAFSPTQMSEKY